jgi:hypothetical protein
MDDEWFVFSFVIGGGIMLALDYVSQKGLGKPWLSSGWLQRIGLMVLVGTLVLSAVSYTLAQLLSIVDLARSLSAKPQALLSLIPLMLGATAGIWIMHLGAQAWRRGLDLRQSGLPIGSALTFAKGLALWVLATMCIGAGSATSFLMLRSV